MRVDLDLFQYQIKAGNLFINFEGQYQWYWLFWREKTIWAWRLFLKKHLFSKTSWFIFKGELPDSMQLLNNPFMKQGFDNAQKHIADSPCCDI